MKKFSGKMMTLNATYARNMSEVNDAFGKAEAINNLVTDVEISPLAHLNIMKTQNCRELFDVTKRGYTLWGAKVHVVNDGALIIWDEKVITEREGTND